MDKLFLQIHEKFPLRSQGKMPLLLAWCGNLRSGLPSGNVLLSVITVASRNPPDFMWNLQESTKAPRFWHSVEESQYRCYPCQRNWTQRGKIIKFVGFWRKNVQITKSSHKGSWQETPRNTGRSRDVIGSSKQQKIFERVWNGGHLWNHQSRQLQCKHLNWSCWRKQKPQFDFCHCQNLTVPRRTRLSLFIRVD